MKPLRHNVGHVSNVPAAQRHVGNVPRKVHARPARGLSQDSMPTRRGAVLVVALVTLAVASVLLVAIVQTLAVQRKAARTELWRIQAAWLAESALNRAAARLALGPDYAGETWTVTAEELGGPHAAAVQIEVGPVAGASDLRQVRVRVDYPDDPIYRVRKTREATIPRATSS